MGLWYAALAVLRMFPLHLLCYEFVPLTEIELFLLERVTLTCFHNTVRSRHTVCPRLWSVCRGTLPLPSLLLARKGHMGPLYTSASTCASQPQGGPSSIGSLKPTLMWSWASTSSGTLAISGHSFFLFPLASLFICRLTTILTAKKISSFHVFSLSYFFVCRSRI